MAEFFKAGETLQAMNELMTLIQSDVESLESSILRNMAFFGASECDIEKIKPWLRDQLNMSLKQEILNMLRGLDRR